MVLLSSFAGGRSCGGTIDEKAGRFDCSRRVIPIADICTAATRDIVLSYLLPRVAQELNTLYRWLTAFGAMPLLWHGKIQRQTEMAVTGNVQPCPPLVEITVNCSQGYDCERGGRCRSIGAGDGSAGLLGFEEAFPDVGRLRHGFAGSFESGGEETCVCARLTSNTCLSARRPTHCISSLIYVCRA